MADVPHPSPVPSSRVRRNRSAALPDEGFPYSTTMSAGPMLFTAGISPRDADGAMVAPGDVVGQTRQCLANLRFVLTEQGTDLAEVAKLTVYVAEHLQADLVVAWDVVVEEFGDAVPAAMMVGVTVLPYDGQVVEVDAIAAIPQR